jgi:hypothetical protein
VVSDRERIIIHTAFTGYPDEPREIRIDDLINPQPREILRWVFTDPEKLRPGKSFKAITEAAAARFADLAARMRHRRIRLRSSTAASAWPISSCNACSACSPRMNGCCRKTSSPTC